MSPPFKAPTRRRIPKFSAREDLSSSDFAQTSARLTNHRRAWSDAPYLFPDIPNPCNPRLKLFRSKNRIEVRPLFDHNFCMLARVCSAALNGIEAYPVEVEVNAGYGDTLVVIVGLPDAAVKESRDRVSTALTNSGFKFPMGRTTINLAPADVKKEGPSFDLPIAVGMLAASEQIETDQLDNFIVVGELALTGAVRPCKGVLPVALRAKAEGKIGVLVPAENAAEAAVVEGLQVIPIQNLTRTPCDLPPAVPGRRRRVAQADRLGRAHQRVGRPSPGDRGPFPQEPAPIDRPGGHRHRADHRHPARPDPGPQVPQGLGLKFRKLGMIPAKADAAGAGEVPRREAQAPAEAGPKRLNAGSACRRRPFRLRDRSWAISGAWCGC